MPLTAKGQEILENMEKNYGSREKAERVLYASKNAGKISGIDKADSISETQRKERVEQYKQAHREGKISAKELDAFIEALARLAVQNDDNYQSAGAQRMRFGNVTIERSGDKFVVQGKTYGTYEEAKRVANAARSDDDAIPELRDRAVAAALHAFEDAAFRLDGAKARPDATIYEALRSKLGREPSNSELKAEVERIRSEGLVQAAEKGRLSHQRKR